MADRNGTHQQQPTPTPLTPQPNRILAEPATVHACQQDYATAADVRARIDHQQARHPTAGSSEYPVRIPIDEI